MVASGLKKCKILILFVIVSRYILALVLWEIKGAAGLVRYPGHWSVISLVSNINCWVHTDVCRWVCVLDVTQ